MIINLRGTHGSGKSTTVKKLIDQYCKQVHGPEKKPLGYYLEIPGITPAVYVVGSYRTACGGCDSIQPYAEIWPRIETAAKDYHVLFEGALVSSSYGNIGRASEEYGSNFVFAFMDTPLQTCLDRIKARRAAKGDHRPLDPKNTEHKYNSIQQSIAKIRDEFKRRVIIVPHKWAVTTVLTLLKHG